MKARKEASLGTPALRITASDSKSIDPYPQKVLVQSGKEVGVRQQAKQQKFAPQRANALKKAFLFC